MHHRFDLGQHITIYLSLALDQEKIRRYMIMATTQSLQPTTTIIIKDSNPPNFENKFGFGLEKNFLKRVHVCIQDQVRAQSSRLTIIPLLLHFNTYQKTGSRF